ncbi:MAG: DUF2911 domain-containing protein [Lewinella sp.]|nr:DUF2911 domain-containing protein [Lewinella sp.]
MRSALLLTKLLFLFAFTLSAQITTPPASASSEERTQIGLTHFTLRYHRPAVKGRRIFGELVPYDQVWRTGANEATLLSFDQPIRIGDATVDPGTYALYSIPGESNWTFIFNRDTSLWGARGYDPTADVLRHEVPVQMLPAREEVMALRWRNITHTAAELTLEWEFVRAALPVQVFTHDQVAAQLATGLGDDATGPDYYRAARYYFDNDLDLDQARTWMDRRMELDGEQFGVMRYQALIELALADTAAATATMQRSLELAREAGNDHYVAMNERSLLAWRKEAVALTGAEVLARSIAYHDPTGAWATGRFVFQLYESRPGGGYRISDVLIDQGEGVFALTQRRDRDLLHRFIGPDSCSVRLNGSAEIPAEAARRFRLSCEQSAVYVNYYTYLWGLPMKLRDAGTRVYPVVHRTDFFGESLLEVKVSYDPAVGEDVWYFYFHPETYQLRGYRFYHDEAANDGEYILLEGEAAVGPLRLPARRHWYTHGDRLYLGSDVLIRAGEDE